MQQNLIAGSCCQNQHPGAKVAHTISMLFTLFLMGPKWVWYLSSHSPQDVGSEALGRDMGQPSSTVNLNPPTTCLLFPQTHIVSLISSMVPLSCLSYYKYGNVLE